MGPIIKLIKIINSGVVLHRIARGNEGFTAGFIVFTACRPAVITIVSTFKSMGSIIHNFIDARKVQKKKCKIDDKIKRCKLKRR